MLHLHVRLFSFHEEPLDEVFKHLQQEGVICDIRKPNVMRVAPTPLYNSFTDVYEFIQILKGILIQGDK